MTDLVWIGLALVLCFAFWLGVACGRFEPIIFTRPNIPSARAIRRGYRRQKADLRAALNRGGAFVSGKRLAYVPLDRTLSLLSVRVLRALQHFDDASVGEIKQAMHVSSARPIWLALNKHVEAGRVARGGLRYRITDEGRRWLDDMIERSTPTIARAL